MKIVVAGSLSSWEELKNDNIAIEWLRVNDAADFALHTDAAAFFNLDANAATSNYKGLPLVFINCVTTRLADIPNASNLIRINGWNGFLSRNTWEVAGNHRDAENILKAINKKMIVVADEPGFIAARILAMIINEAYFAKGENVSTEKEIDTAMRLGTNYPKGPFEWAAGIGIRNIYSLLEKLNETDSRYQPAPLLQNEFSL